MPKNPIKKQSRESAVDQFIYQLKQGNVTHGSTAPGPEMVRHNGPAKHTYPKKADLPKFLDYDNMDSPKLYPNKVKFGIENQNESRYPKESKVPNVKKYDAAGRYIKHKLPLRDKSAGNISTNQIIRRNALSNPAKRKPKTVA